MSSLACLLAAPLILGASMSAGVSATDPVTLLASRVRPDFSPMRRAASHEPSAASLGKASAQDYEKSSVVTALDLFFWDSASGACDAASKRAAEFIDRMRREKRPLAVGTIPLQETKCGAAVSKTIRDVCEYGGGCVVVDLEELTRRAQKGEFKTKQPLFVKDGLHPTKRGSLLIARELEEKLSRGGLSCGSEAR
jgi:hypothetical protein